MQAIHKDIVDVGALKSRLTFRYSLAVSLIACVMILSFLLLSYQISRNEQDAYLVNISGMQRMLSQRIVFLGGMAQREPEVARKEWFLEEMRQGLDMMEVNQNALSSGDLVEKGRYDLTPGLREIYFGEVALDAAVRDYIAKGRRVYEEMRGQAGEGGEEAAGILNDLRSLAYGDFLLRLDQAVGLQQQRAEENIAVFHRLEFWVLIFGLIVLALEILLIFRPLVIYILNMVQRLNHANNALMEFSYRISHDLRAPAVSARGIAQVGLDAIGKPDKAPGKSDVTLETCFVHIQSSMQRLETLIDDIMVMTRVKLEEQALELLDLKALGHEIAQKMDAFQRDGHPVALSFDVQVEGCVGVKGFYLRQILENLVSNAIKYADPAQALPYVKVVMTRKGEEIIVTVEDNGLGIPAEFRADLFSMFRRFHPRVSFGSGLGLYIVHENISALGGHIRYIPKDDQGSIFEFTFPDHQGEAVSRTNAEVEGS